MTEVRTDDWPPFAREAHRRLMVAAFGGQPQQAFHDRLGRPLAGGKIHVYIHGTTIPAATYSDQSLRQANTNPVIADAAGRVQLFLLPGEEYDFIVENEHGEIQYTTVGLRLR